MNHGHSTSVKKYLLQLSEEIVDLSNVLESAGTQEGNQKVHASVSRLRGIGDELVDHLELTSGDDLAFVQFMMGSVCSLLGFWGNAEKSYRQALDHWPDHIGILNELFDALVAQRKYDQAENIIIKSMKYGGETPPILRNYAAILVHQKKLNEAKVVMFNCLAKFPDDRESRGFLEKLELSSRC
ncbi:MAG: hypothetical protein WD097_05275 [Balneolales bacterium]